MLGRGERRIAVDVADRIQLVGLDRGEGGGHLLTGMAVTRSERIHQRDDVSCPRSVGHVSPWGVSQMTRPPYDPLVLTDISRRAAADFSATDAYLTEAGWGITYAELDRAADEAAAGLVTRGVEAGDAVALLLPSVIDYVVLYLALARIGAATAGINPRLRPREIAGCIEVLDPALVVATADLVGAVDADRFATEVIEPGTDAATVAAEFRVSGAEPLPALPDDGDRPVCICFTSGSTGQPKGAWYTNRQLRCISDLDTGGAWGGGGHGISPTQFAHVGFMTKLPWLLASGRTTHLLDRWSAGPVLRLMWGRICARAGA